MAKKILIVEDNALNMKLFSSLLKMGGYEVAERTDALKIITSVKEEQPDIILMDIQLPMISGIEATKILKADDTFCRIPVIAITAFAMKGDEEKILAAGCDGYIAKPIEPDSFIATINRFLNRTESHGDAA